MIGAGLDDAAAEQKRAEAAAFEAELAKREWLASDRYSLADVNGFNLAAGNATTASPFAPSQRDEDNLQLGVTWKTKHATGWNASVVLTDEQSADKVPAPAGKGYVINVASNKNGVGYGPWVHIDGWSEAVIDYLQELENQQAKA